MAHTFRAVHFRRARIWETRARISIARSFCNCQIDGFINFRIPRFRVTVLRVQPPEREQMQSVSICKCQNYWTLPTLDTRISFSPLFFFIYDSKITLRILFNPELRQKKTIYILSLFLLFHRNLSLMILLLKFLIQNTVVFTERERERVSKRANLSYEYSEVQHLFGHASSTRICHGQTLERCWMTCQHICRSDNTLEQSCPCPMGKREKRCKVTPLRSTLIKANSLVRFTRAYRRRCKFKLVWSIVPFIVYEEKKCFFNKGVLALLKQYSLHWYSTYMRVRLKLLELRYFSVIRGKWLLKFGRGNVIGYPRRRDRFRLQLKI